MYGARVFASCSACAVLAMTTFALAFAVGIPAAHADALDAIKDTVNRDRGNAADCFAYFYNPELEGIAQTYARSENRADVTNARYNGNKVGFLGSGDPQAAATNSAYRNGAGGMIGNCDFTEFGVGFVRHEDREVDVVTIVFGQPKPPAEKPPAKHEYNPVGPPLGPCASGTYKFVGNVVLDLHDFDDKNERGTVVTVPATPDGKIAGRADGTFTGVDHGGGNATGQITGNDVDITVAFDGGEVGGVFAGANFHFVGKVLAAGGAAGTVTSTEGREPVDWHTRSTESIVCAPVGPAPTAAKTATVNKPDDIYDKPDGTGTAYKNDDGSNIFKPAGPVQLVAPDLCRDNWCHVVAPEIPGPAWIYAGEGFVTVP